MRVIRGLQHWPAEASCVATIGNFDGVHLGHQAILAQLAKSASAFKLPGCVITFDPLPHEYFSPDTAPARLQGFRNRYLSMSACHVDQLLLLRFNDVFANQSAEQFVRATLIETLKVRHLIIGDDFRFGRGRLGDFALLKQFGREHGFGVERNVTISDPAGRISSTRIREHLGNGELAAAAGLLGHHYRISGRVHHGEKVGRQLGFPTANIGLHAHRPPLRGVFAVVVHNHDHSVSWAAVANLGERPTIGGRKLLLEVHILDQDVALYGQHLHVDFHHRLREERRFDSLDELKAAIGRDAEQARELLNNDPGLIYLANRLH